MPRSRKQPAHISEVAEQLKADIPNLTTAAELGPHTEAVLARRPKFLVEPPGFHQTASDTLRGMAVNKGFSRDNGVFDIAAIQFSDAMPPSEGRHGEWEDGEKGRLRDAGFFYHLTNRQWQREDREHPGANQIDAVRLMQDMAAVRKQAQGQSR